MIKNPIITGFSGDPSICRKGEDYYLAVSSLEWFPGCPIYHSKDLKNWELITHALSNEKYIDLRALPSARGIWAPCLTYCEEEDLFYLCYNVMRSTEARFFDVDNYCITSKNIMGEWSEPTYLHSAGFDGSMFHDDNGKKYFLSMEWETRENYHKPGEICIVEYDAKKKSIIDYPKRIWNGGTKRGCIEGPHMYKYNDYYYLLCAEGGTGYGHCVTVARSKSPFGPFQADPLGAVLTSAVKDFNEMDNDDYLKPQYFNPNITLQKAGHGDIVETPLGEIYMVHHSGRPMLPELRCTLGRESCIQKMQWTDDYWLRKYSDANDCFADEYVESPKGINEQLAIRHSKKFDLSIGKLPLEFQAPRIPPQSFAEVNNKTLYIRGQESLSSCNRTSYLAHHLTGLNDSLQAKLKFNPERYQHYAGLCIYYDNYDYILLRKTYSEALNSEVLDLLRVRLGERTEIQNSVCKIKSDTVCMRVNVKGNKTYFEYSENEMDYRQIGPYFITSEFSDEFCKEGEFTGTTIGLYCVDALMHKKVAEFVNIEYIDHNEK